MNSNNPHNSKNYGHTVIIGRKSTRKPEDVQFRTIDEERASMKLK